MGITFPIKVGDKFQDDLGNVVIFEDYDWITNTVFLLLETPGIEFSQPWNEFYQQYLLGIILEVCDGPVAKEAA
jgi:hypothetical protein